MKVAKYIQPVQTRNMYQDIDDYFDELYQDCDELRQDYAELRQDYANWPLRKLAIRRIARLIFTTWDLKFEEMQTIMEINNDCHKYLKLPHRLCHQIIRSMRRQHKIFSFGHVIWIMESNCKILYKTWLQNDVSLNQLCQVASEDAKYSIQDFVVDHDEITTDFHLAKHFGSLRRLVFEFNQVVDWQIQEIISNCPLLSELYLEKCINITDDFANFIWRQRSIQEHLRKLDIRYTGISGGWAATLYFLLPRLEKLKYDDVASFLRYKCNCQTNENVIRRGLDHTVCLGDHGIGSCQTLKFATDEELSRVMKVNVPNRTLPPFDEEGHRNIFRFDNANFQDVYLAMCSVAPHETFGVSPEKAYLKEVAFYEMQNIDLNALLSYFPQLKSIRFWKSSLILDPGNKLHLSQSVTDIELFCVSSKFINKTLKQCPNVEQLSISEVKISKKTLVNLTFNSIKEVKLYGCETYVAIQNVFPLNTRIEISSMIPF